MASEPLQGAYAETGCGYVCSAPEWGGMQRGPKTIANRRGRIRWGGAGYADPVFIL
ncbi:Uncharacterised protein [Rikenella microfusus]|uniref:Uncharacterized protein n=1 Tax=Rikenella microfusus TaxID=28139 RepID=A0A379MNQ3_9BACT|nr:Uncharacterised protein [Rikenella microfusus]